MYFIKILEDLYHALSTPETNPILYGIDMINLDDIQWSLKPTHIWAIIILITSLIAGFFQVFELINDTKTEQLPIIFSLLSFILLIPTSIGLYKYIYVAKNKPTFSVLQEKFYKEEYKYDSKKRTAAAVAIGLLSTITLTSIIWLTSALITQHKALFKSDEGGIKVLVARLENDKQDELKYTSKILQSLEDLSDSTIAVKLHNEHIKESYGSNYARRIGEMHNADIVIWGYYFPNDELTIYNEIINKDISISFFESPSDANQKYNYFLDKAEQKSFITKSNIKKDLDNSLTLTKSLLSLGSNDFQVADSLLSISIANNSNSNDSTNLYLLRGIARVNSGLNIEAIKDLNIYLQSHSQSEVALLQKSLALGGLGKTEEAVNVLNKLIDISPSNILYLYNKAEYLLGLSRFSDAIETSNSINSTSNYINSLTNMQLGKAYLKLKDLDNADIYLSKADSIYTNSKFPPSELVHYVYIKYWKGITHYEKGQYQESITSFNDALAQDSILSFHFDNNPSDNDHSPSQIKASLFSSIIVTFDDLEDREKTASKILYSSGVSHYKMNLYERARVLLEKAIKLDSLSSNTLSAYCGTMWALKNHQKALSSCSKSLALDSTNVSALVNYSLITLENNQYNKALEFANKAIAADSLNPLPWNTRGLYFSELDSLFLAFDDFQKAIRIDSTFEPAYHNMGKVLYRYGRPDKSIYPFTISIELAPNSPDSYVARSGSWLKGSRCIAALNDAKKAIELGSEDPYAYINLGAAQLCLSQFEDSIISLKEALILDPLNAMAYRNMSRSLHQLGRFKEAHIAMEKAGTLEPSRYEKYDSTKTLGPPISFHEMEDAIPYFEKILEQDTFNVNIAASLGYYYYSSGRHQKAIDIYNKIDEKKLLNNHGLFIRAKAFINNQNHKEARRDLTDLINRDSTKHEYFFTSGGLFKKTKNDSLAIIEYTNAIRINKSNLDYRIERSNAYLRLKKPEKAIFDLDYNLNIDPNHASSLHARSYAYMIQKRYDQAIEDFESLLRSGDKSTSTYSNYSSALLALNKTAKSIEMIDKAIELDSTDIRLAYQKAFILQESEKWNESITAWSNYYAVSESKNNQIRLRPIPVFGLISDNKLTEFPNQAPNLCGHSLYLSIKNKSKEANESADKCISTSLKNNNLELWHLATKLKNNIYDTKP